MLIRRAQPDDVDRIVTLRRLRTAWLQQRDTDQWSVGLTEDGFISRVRDSIDDGDTWVIEHDGAVVATMAADTWANADLWTADELRTALILHRMITDPEMAGRALGTQLLDHATEIARAAGRPWLRLDAWTTNKALHRYYEAQGFRHVRNADHPISRSTALFERWHGLADANLQ